MVRQKEEWEVITDGHKCLVTIDRDEADEPIIKIRQDNDSVWLDAPATTDLITALQAALSALKD